MRMQVAIFNGGGDISPIGATYCEPGYARFQIPRLRAGSARTQAPPDLSERNPHTDLDLAARGRGFGDRSELRRVHEAARCAQVRVIERVEEFGAELEFHLLGNVEFAGQREVEGLHSRAVYGIPPR